MSIRKDFISFTSSLSGALPLYILSKLSGQNFIVPFYHIVSDQHCPHIRHLYRYKNTKEFERDLDYLALHYKPIAAGDLANVMAGKYKDEKIMLLTFDDGLRQIYDIVAPILLRKGIPAVFFLNTDFIDNKALMFRYKASLAMETDPIRFQKALLSRNEHELEINTHNELNKLFEDFLQSYEPYMVTKQIRTLVSQGFAIGAHSCSHPYYEGLPLKEQLSQTLSCIDILKRDFGITQKLFAFPFTDHGVSRQFFEEIFKDGKIDFSFGGAGIKNDIDARQIQRIPMEAGGASAEQLLKSEYLYYLLRMPLFKNMIKRV